MNIRLARMSDAQAIAQVHVESWQATYQAMFPSEFLSQLSVPAFTQQWIGRLSVATKPGQLERVFVGEVKEGSVAGFVWGGPEHSGFKGYDGQFYKLYLLPEYQRQGLGRRLTLGLVRHFIQLGYSSMHLPVFSDNQVSRHFFRSLVGEVIAEQDIRLTAADGILSGAVDSDTDCWPSGYPHMVHLREVTYGWRDLHRLEVTLMDFIDRHNHQTQSVVGARRPSDRE